MTKCWSCGSEMTWQNDFLFEDYGYDGDGIVATLNCSNDSCGSTAEFATKMEDN